MENRWHQHLSSQLGHLLIQRDHTQLVAIATGIMGAINLLSSATPGMAERVHFLATISPLEVRQGSRLTAVLAGFALILLARSLGRRKAVAWWLTMIVLALSIISHLAKGLDYEEATLALLLAIGLWLQRSHFHALSDPPSFRQGIRVLITALLFTLTYGIIGFYLLDQHFHVHYAFAEAVRQTAVMFTQFYDPQIQPITGFGRYFVASIYIIGAGTGGYALLMLLRPVLIHRPASASDRQRATQIVQAHGRTVLARFALFADKVYFFSPGGSVIAYVAKGHVAVALGDPIGPPADAAAAITAFTAFCARNDWQAAFYQTLPDYLDHYHATGFAALCIGHEGIVDLATFTLSKGDNKSLRTTTNRFTRLGYQAIVHEPRLTPTLLGELRAISDEWLTMMHSREQRFSVGWFDDEYVGNTQVMALHTPEGAISAFVNFVPAYQQNELGADLMRRRQEIEPSSMEFLFVAFLQWAKAQGYASFNLGLSALSGVGENVTDPAIEQALHYIYTHINQFYNFQGLHTFKEKFHPTWSPRYLVYPGAGDLVRVLWVLQSATSGDGWVSQYGQTLLQSLRQWSARPTSLRSPTK